MSKARELVSFAGWFRVAGGRTWRQVEGTIRATHREAYDALLDECRGVSGDLAVLPLGRRPDRRLRMPRARA